MNVDLHKPRAEFTLCKTLNKIVKRPKLPELPFISGKETYYRIRSPFHEPDEKKRDIAKYINKFEVWQQLSIYQNQPENQSRPIIKNESSKQLGDVLSKSHSLRRSFRVPSQTTKSKKDDIQLELTMTLPLFERTRTTSNIKMPTHSCIDESLRKVPRLQTKEGLSLHTEVSRPEADEYQIWRDKTIPSLRKKSKLPSQVKHPKNAFLLAKTAGIDDLFANPTTSRASNLKSHERTKVFGSTKHFNLFRMSFLSPTHRPSNTQVPPSP